MIGLDYVVDFYCEMLSRINCYSNPVILRYWQEDISNHGMNITLYVV